MFGKNISDNKKYSKKLFFGTDYYCPCFSCHNATDRDGQMKQVKNIEIKIKCDVQLLV